MLRAPPDGFGAFTYNKDTNLTLEALSGSINIASAASIYAGNLSLIAQEGIYSLGAITTPNTLTLISTGDIYSLGSLQATRLIERGNAFKVGGTFNPGYADIKNSDNAIEYSADTDVSGTIADVGNIIVDSSVILTMTADTSFIAGNAFTMDPTSTIAGGGYNLGISAGSNSTLGNINNVNLFTLSSDSGLDVTFTSNPSSTFQVDTVKTDYHAILSRSVGTGTAIDPLIIYSVSNAPGGLQYIPTSGLNLYYQVANNIDASETLYWNAGAGFVPIGNDSTPFTGSFNGNNHAISNLAINTPYNSYVGLFGYTSYAAILSNIQLNNVNVTGDSSVGGLAGRNNGSITDSYSTGAVIGGVSVGGLVGGNNGSINSSYSTSTVLLLGGHYIHYSFGGLVGWNYGSITNSYATGTVSSSDYVGGLVGYNVGSITNSYATGAPYGGSNVGGLVGYNGSSITNSYATGAVIGGVSVGGLVGGNNGSINSSYSTGTVDGGTEVGGLVGSNNPVGSITNSCATGAVNGAGKVGGLVGDNLGSISDSYSTGVVNGNTAGGLVGRNIGSIDSSYSTGSVTGGYVGGLVGLNAGSIDGSYSTGTVSGTGLYVGGLVAANGGSITNSYATGAVTGSRDYVGGLVGWNVVSITNSYATGTVSGSSDYVGGLAGENDGSIDSSYSTGAVNGGSYVGGLVGYNSYSITNSGWWTGAAAQPIGNGGTVSYNESDPRAFYNPNHGVYTAGATLWDISNSPGHVWIMAGYPHLQIEWTPTITNLPQLQMMLLNLSASYHLANNIDASETAYWNAIQGFVPIGNSSTPFTGSLDGNIHAISNLTINTPSNSYIGLFGYTSNTSTLSSIQLDDVNITGASYVGGLVGRNNGSITNSYTTGTVTGGGNFGGWVGGLVGENYGSITNSYSTSNLAGSYLYTGGLVGWNYGAIDNSYSTGTVSGGYDAGGLVGANDGSITNSYHAGNVGGFLFIGGLVGLNGSDGSITNSYSTGTAGCAYRGVGGLVGYNSGSISHSYTTVAVSGASGVGNLGGLAGENYGSITNSYSTGSVGEGDSAGGLAGWNYGSISDSYATGAVIGGYAGGLVGGNEGSITNSYATGTVTGASYYTGGYVGGLVGYNYGSGSIDNSYSTGIVSGNYSVGGLVGSNAGSITNCGWWTGSAAQPIGNGGAVTYNESDPTAFYNPNHGVYTAGATPWDFVNTWDAFASTYPHLKWEHYISPPFGINISGTAFSGIGESPLGSGVIIILVVNGVQDGSTSTNISGLYSFSNIIADAGNAILVYLSGNAIKGNTVTVSNGSDISNLNIYGDALTLRHETPNPITNLILAAAKGSLTDTDILYSVSGPNLTANTSIYIYPGMTFAPGGDIQISGSWINEGTFTAGSGTVTFSGSGAITSGNSHFYDVIFDSASGSWSLNDALIVDDNLNITAGTLTMIADTSFTVGNAFTMDSTSTIAGGGYNLSISAGSNSTLGNINNVNLFTLSSGTGSDVTFTSNPSSTFQVNTVKTNYHSILSRSVGTGTSLNPIMIYSVSNAPGGLQYIPTSGLNRYYLVANNIDASETVYWNAGAGFVPIGYDPTSFIGSFNGNNHAISNLTINTPSNSFVGLFGRTYAANLSNIRLYNINVTGYTNVGSLVGLNWGSVSDSSATGTVSGTSDVGGLVGYNINSIINSCASVIVSGGNLYSVSSAGGLVGYNYGSIINSFSTGAVSGTANYVGGLVGRNIGSILSSFSTSTVTGSSSGIAGLVGQNKGSITNSYATGTVSGSSTLVGGLVAYNVTGSSITNSYATGTVSGNQYVGGLVGVNNGAISSSFATGAVSSNSGYAGGLVGTNSSSIINSYSTGNVNGGTEIVGGLAGWNAGFLTDSYSNGTVSGVSYVGGLVGVNSSVITNAYSTGAVSGSNYVGGLAGYNYDSITNSYFTDNTHGDQTGKGIYEPGGVVAFYTPAHPVYNIGGSSQWDIFTPIWDFYTDELPHLHFEHHAGNIYSIWSGLTSSDWSTPSNWVGGIVPSPTANIFIAVAPNYPAVSSNLTSSSIFLVSGVILDLNGQSLTVSGTFTNNGTFKLIGSETLSIGIFIDNGTTDYYGSGTYVITPLGTYNNLQFDNGTFVLGTANPVTFTAKGNIILNPNVTLDMIADTNLIAGNAFTMAPTSTIAGGGYNLYISAGSDSLLGNIINVNLFTLNDDFNITFTSYPTSAFQVNTVKTNYRTVLSRSVGTGASSDPIIIYSVSNAPGGLAYIPTSGLNLYYQLANNIDASETAYWNGGAGFVPIGNDSARFTRSMNGNGHSISNLTINTPSNNYVGLFGYTSSTAILSNILLNNVNITGHSHVGGLVGRNNGSITNSYSTGTVSGASYVGGLAGFNADGASITNAYSIGVVSGTSYVGGLVGLKRNKGSITNCGWWTGAAAQPIGSGGTVTYNESSPTAFYNPNHGIYTAGTTHWDFVNIWDSFGSTFPHLKWEHFIP